jgi:peptide/nickel transport system substrate-binding protein
MLVLNTRQAPIDDPAVRRALALAIDREALVKGVLDGVGAAAYGIAPEGIGLDGVIRTQKYDLAEARRVLDAAGWTPAADGVRTKDGRRLEFKLGTYPGRAELEEFAVVIKDQLKAAGMDATIEKFTDVETELARNSFSATTYSIGSAAFGDLSRLLSTLYVPSPRNRDRYANPRVTDLFNQYLVTPDAATRTNQLRQMQELIGQDTPIVHLVNPYQIVGASKKVKGFAPHPLDNYKYHADIYIED